VESLAVKERLSTARKSSPGLWEFDVTLDIPLLLLNFLGGQVVTYLEEKRGF
jgi:hypothetical protein